MSAHCLCFPTADILVFLSAVLHVMCCVAMVTGEVPAWAGETEGGVGESTEGGGRGGEEVPRGGVWVCFLLDSTCDGFFCLTISTELHVICVCVNLKFKPLNYGLKFIYVHIKTGASDTGGNGDASDAPLFRPDLPQSRWTLLPPNWSSGRYRSFSGWLGT